jgi:predicted nucleic acid-binding protein
MHYLLDTNICIYLIKKRPPEVIERFRQHSPEEVAISTITLFELEYGVQKKIVSREKFRNAAKKSLRGRPPGTATEKSTTVRFNIDVLEACKSTGKAA